MTQELSEYKRLIGEACESEFGPDWSPLGLGARERREAREFDSDPTKKESVDSMEEQGPMGQGQGPGQGQGRGGERRRRRLRRRDPSTCPYRKESLDTIADLMDETDELVSVLGYEINEDVDDPIEFIETVMDVLASLAESEIDEATCEALIARIERLIEAVTPDETPAEDEPTETPTVEATSGSQVRSVMKPSLKRAAAGVAMRHVGKTVVKKLRKRMKKQNERVENKASETDSATSVAPPPESPAE